MFVDMDYNVIFRMRVLLLLLVAGVALGGRVPRQVDCEGANEAHTECTTQ